MTVEFVPLDRMQDRVDLAKDESDTSYFLELLYLGELMIKMLVLETLAGLQDDRDGHRYSLEFKLLRTDGIGGWAEILDEALTGPASQHLITEARDSQRELTTRFSPSDESWQRTAVDLLNEVCRQIDAPREDTSRQRASLRQWVRDFTWLRNRTRGHGAPRGETMSAACVALQESIYQVKVNSIAFLRPWAFLRRNLSGKYRVSVIGGDREKFEYLTRERDRSFDNGSYVYLDGPRRVPFLFTDADLSDFFVPNGNFRGQSFEVLSYISDETRSESGSDWTLPAEARPISETAATPDLDVMGNLFSNMPPRPEGYVRRELLESELTRVLRDGRHPVITLQGRGGVGKTSLTLSVLHDFCELDDFFAIIWFSARDIDLLPQGPKVVRADVLSTKDIARDFGRLMHPEEALKSVDASRYFTDCLSGQASDGPFIFVLDNFETIRDPVELYAYLSNAVRPPNKVLITTRTRDFKADYPIEVSGMSRDEFARLVRETAMRLGISALINPTYEERLFEESDGHPYIAKVLLGEVAQAGRAISPKRVVATKETMLDALFERSFAALSPSAQRVFLTLCSWRSLVPRVGLEAILLRPANERLDVERALTELEQTSLIEVLGEGNRGESFLSVPLAASLFGKKKLITSPFKISIEADLELIREFGVTTTTEAVRGIGPRVERLARIAAHRAEKGALLTQELAVIEYIASEYAPALLTLAELQEQQLNDLAGAINSVSRYLESRPDDEMGWQRLIRLNRSAGDPLAEMNARLQFVQLGRPPYSELSSAASRLNGLLARREIALDAHEKSLLVRRLRMLMEARAAEATATDLSRLAWLCMHDHEISAAERWVGEGLALEPTNEHCVSLKQRLAGEDDL